MFPHYVPLLLICKFIEGNNDICMYNNKKYHVKFMTPMLRGDTHLYSNFNTAYKFARDCAM